MEKNKWVWMAHPGHFICSKNCKFFLNTYVGKYIVSSVGELWLERSSREIHARINDPIWYDLNKHLLGDEFDYVYMKRFGYEDIGLDRKYETIVFKAKKSKNKCCPYEIIVSKEVETNCYNSPEDAYKGHLKLCKKWSKK
jgi:hypothetical protein